MRCLNPITRTGFRIAALAGGMLLIGMVFATGQTTPTNNSWPLVSPDGRCRIAVTLGEDGTPSYEVWFRNQPVLRRSPLGIRREDQDLTRGLIFESASQTEARRETYALFAGGAARVDHALNGRTLRFRNANQARMEIELAASREGVAFRYRFPDSGDGVRVVEAEVTGFAISPDARGWLQPHHAAGPYTPAYEDYYFQVAPGDPPPDSRARAMGWAFPALFQIPGAGAWMLLTESGTDGTYCGCHLAPDSSGGLYRLAFPLADEATKGQSSEFGPEPRFRLPWTLPWRVVVLGEVAGDIAMATLTTDLAPPSRIADTSWIRPGRASWAWWSHPEGPATAELFNSFTDLAADLGWEYTLFDAGWWKPGLLDIARHATSLGVVPLAWTSASDFYGARGSGRKLDEMVAAGVGGVKVDFWCSDRQEAMAAMHALFAAAAERRLVVNLHGCTLPRGWERTWPNFLTSEAVLGTESYFYDSRYPEKAAELNTVLPFTRNAVGPMDVTPVACSPKRYARITSAAHELATAIILKSGLIHYADTPEFFASLPPEAREILRNAPARWEETRCLAGEPGKEVIFARRTGGSWFVAGLNGTDHPRRVDLDLTAFAGVPQRLLVAEGADPLMQVTIHSPPPGPRWRHEMPPRGGFILRLDP